MDASLRTLTKILSLEQSKGCQNTSVIGGVSRFIIHWAREARGKARSAEQHALVESIVALLKDYDALSEADRLTAINSAISYAATGNVGSDMPAAVSELDTAAPVRLDSPVDSRLRGESATVVASQVVTSVSTRERRGYAPLESTFSSADLIGRLAEPLASIKNIGDKRAQLFSRLGVETIDNILHYYPYRHDDYSRMKMISHVALGEDVTVIGTLTRIQKRRTKQGLSRIEAYLEDDSGSLRLNWFNQPWMEEHLSEAEAVVASGRIEQFLGRLVMNSPELEPLEAEWLQAGRIVPVYHLTRGLSGRTVRKVARHVVDIYARQLPDFLPLIIREENDLMDHGDAVAQMHFPDSQEDLVAARTRLAFEELFILHAGMLRQRQIWQAYQGVPLQVGDEWLSTFVAGLPYTLTNAQQRVIIDIRQDLARDLPMNRLLQGDVGSGKTIVAAIAMMIAAANGAQAALMSPTSILAEQHYTTLSSIMSNSSVNGPTNLALLTGDTSASDRELIYSGLADGTIQFVVGTHALIQPDVQFAKLGLAIVDEQHRFGVAQRAALRGKANGGNPHLLVMTATPIPRTLALTIHADLDLSIIDELPPGRKTVDTKVLQPKERERAYSFIRSQIEMGRQAFIIYPLVDESEKLDVRAAVVEQSRLQEKVFPDLQVGLMHGRLRPDEKERIMNAFYLGELQILASTSVIEVGIDVPNATVMLVENANRFGLAQLHQLRGRVGRGDYQGYCLLMSDQPFLDEDGRLEKVASTNDGFSLAQFDWETRGAGDLLGELQSGFSQLDIVRLMNATLVETVQRQARALFERDSGLTQPEHQPLVARLSQLGHQGDVS